MLLHCDTTVHIVLLHRDTTVCIVLLHCPDSFVTFFLTDVLVVFGRTNCELLADALVAASWNILSTY